MYLHVASSQACPVSITRNTPLTRCAIVALYRRTVLCAASFCGARCIPSFPTTVLWSEGRRMTQVSALCFPHYFIRITLQGSYQTGVGSRLLPSFRRPPPFWSSRINRSHSQHGCYLINVTLSYIPFGSSFQYTIRVCST